MLPVLRSGSSGAGLVAPQTHIWPCPIVPIVDTPRPRQPDGAAAVWDQVAAAYDGNAAPGLDAVANLQVLTELIGDPAR